MKRPAEETSLPVFSLDATTGGTKSIKRIDVPESVSDEILVRFHHSLYVHFAFLFCHRNSPFKLVIPRSLLRGHLIEGRVRETAGFSVEQSTLIPRQLAAGCSFVGN